MSHVLKQARSSDNPAGRAERHKHKRRDPLSNLECKHRLYKKVGLIGKAFSHEVRLELIELLSQCPQTVEKLSEMLDEDYKSISAHLRVLYPAPATAASSAMGLRAPR